LDIRIAAEIPLPLVPVGERQNVVVVPADSTRGQAGRRELEAALRRELSREEGLLHFEGEVQLRLFARQLVPAGSQLGEDPMQRHGENAHRRRPRERQPPGQDR